MSLYREIVENAAVIYDDDSYAHLKAEDVERFLANQVSKTYWLKKEISDLKADKSHSKSGQYIDVTFKVPVECIEVINARVIDGMAEFESIIIENCDFEIDQNSYDDSMIGQLAAERG